MCRKSARTSGRVAVNEQTERSSWPTTYLGRYSAYLNYLMHLLGNNSQKRQNSRLRIDFTSNGPRKWLETKWISRRGNDDRENGQLYTDRRAACTQVAKHSLSIHSAKNERGIRNNCLGLNGIRLVFWLGHRTAVRWK